MWTTAPSQSSLLEPSPAPRPESAKDSQAGVVTLRSEPLISVIVLNYNGAAWLEHCLTSLAAQTIASEIEILVADNASSDGSDLLAADLLEHRPDWRVVRHADNLG
jgi:cellulose synthase/poly-beta-1,6-N-acetylglucosamine synthase-like glycosyltransferase